MLRGLARQQGSASGLGGAPHWAAAVGPLRLDLGRAGPIWTKPVVVFCCVTSDVVPLLPCAVLGVLAGLAEICGGVAGRCGLPAATGSISVSWLEVVRGPALLARQFGVVAPVAAVCLLSRSDHLGLGSASGGCCRGFWCVFALLRRPLLPPAAVVQAGIWRVSVSLLGGLWPG